MDMDINALLDGLLYPVDSRGASESPSKTSDSVTEQTDWKGGEFSGDTLAPLACGASETSEVNEVTGLTGLTGAAGETGATESDEAKETSGVDRATGVPGAAEATGLTRMAGLTGMTGAKNLPPPSFSSEVGYATAPAARKIAGLPLQGLASSGESIFSAPTIPSESKPGSAEARSGFAKRESDRISEHRMGLFSREAGIGFVPFVNSFRGASPVGRDFLCDPNTIFFSDLHFANAAVRPESAGIGDCAGVSVPQYVLARYGHTPGDRKLLFQIADSMDAILCQHQGSLSASKLGGELVQKDRVLFNRTKKVFGGILAVIEMFPSRFICELDPPHHVLVRLAGGNDTSNREKMLAKLSAGVLLHKEKSLQHSMQRVADAGLKYSEFVDALEECLIPPTSALNRLIRGGHAAKSRVSARDARTSLLALVERELSGVMSMIRSHPAIFSIEKAESSDNLRIKVNKYSSLLGSDRTFQEEVINTCKNFLLHSIVRKCKREGIEIWHKEAAIPLAAVRSACLRSFGSRGEDPRGVLQRLQDGYGGLLGLLQKNPDIFICSASLEASDAKSSDCAVSLRFRRAPAREASENSAAGNDKVAAPSRCLHIAHLQNSYSKKQLQRTFQKYGSVKQVTVVKRNSQHQFAFVHFHDLEAAVRAHTDLRKQRFWKGNLQFAQPKIRKSRRRRRRAARNEQRGDESIPSRHLWVGHLKDTSKEHILNVFRNFGNVENVNFVSGNNYAFVDYHTVEEAVRAYFAMNKKRLGARIVKIMFSHSSNR